MRTLCVVLGLFLSGCFLPMMQGTSGRQGVQLYPEEGPQPAKGSYTPIRDERGRVRRIKVVWQMPRVEGTTRRQLRQERQNGYTASVRCSRRHRHSIDMELMRNVSIMRGVNAIIDLEYGGHYRGSYPRRRLLCWARGTAVHMGSDPPRRPTGTLRIRIRDRNGTRIETRWK